MSPENNKALAKKAIMLWQSGNLKSTEELYSPTCINHQHHHPNSHMDLKGPDSWKRLIQEFRNAFPDIQCTVVDQIAEGTKVVTRTICKGTNKGRLMGIEPTHRTITWTGIIIDRIEGGKIAETWVNWDMYGMLEQLGVASMHATH